MGSLEWVLIPGVAAGMDCEQGMHQPCFLPTVLPLPGTQDSPCAWDEFYLHRLPDSVPAVFPWTSLSRDLGLVADGLSKHPGMF